MGTMMHLFRGLIYLSLVPLWAPIHARIPSANSSVDNIRAVPFGPENSEDHSLYYRANPQCGAAFLNPDAPSCRRTCSASQGDCSNGLRAHNYKIRLNSTTGNGNDNDDDSVYPDFARKGLSKRVFQPLTLAEIREYVPRQTNEDTEDPYYGELISIIEYDDDGEPTEPNVAVQRTFRNAPFQIGTTGLVGCTVVTVVSRRAVYMGHYWEDPNWLKTDIFVTTILNFISNTNPQDGSGPALNPELFNRPTDDTRIYIMHPRAYRKEHDYTVPYYRRKLGQLKTLLNQQLLPGAPTATWIYIPVNPRKGKPDPLADQPWRRHAIFQYDPRAHSTGRRKKGWRLFYEDHYFDDTNPPPGPESANGIPPIP